MTQVERFPYAETDPALGPSSALPYLPIALDHQRSGMTVSALVDSGAALNVLPYDVGLQLGADWEEQTIPVKLSGNLASADARAIIVNGIVGRFAPVRLAFAWSRSNNVPVILGQINFFVEFDVCFYRSQLAFDVTPSGTANP